MEYPNNFYPLFNGLIKDEPPLKTRDLQDSDVAQLRPIESARCTDQRHSFQNSSGFPHGVDKSIG